MARPVPRVALREKPARGNRKRGRAEAGNGDAVCCDAGILTIGEHSVIHQNCRLLLTMPNPKVHIGRWVFVGMNTIIAGKNLMGIGPAADLRAELLCGGSRARLLEIGRDTESGGPS